MKNPFNSREAAELLQRNLPELYDLLREVIVLGVSRETVQEQLRRAVDEANTLDDLLASELVARLSEMAMEYMLAMAAQVQGVEGLTEEQTQ